MELRNDSTISRIALMTGEELKAFREKFDLSQDQLAKELKVARNTVSRWELEERKIPEFLELALQTIERNIKNKSS
jgi:DNA-binding transcriptional regulator YiaG